MTKRGPHVATLAMYAGTIFGLWMIGGIVLTAFEFWRLDVFGRYDIDFSEFVRFGLLRGAVWALVTPLVIWAAFRFAVERPGRLRKVAMLIPVVLFLALLREAFGTTLAQLSMGLPWNPGEIRDAWILRLDVNVVVIAGIMVGANFVRQQRENAERGRHSVALQSEIVKAQLNQLRSDLQPHFLFNALNGIASLVHTDPEQADRMLVALSELLRRTLELRDSPRARLSDELELLRAYLELSRMRFGRKLTFRINAREDVLGLEVPPLLIQPLVENAVRHGRLSAGEEATIEVAAFREEGSLRLQVRDNGPGCDPDTAFGRGGFGLSSTRKRLELLYGDAASMILHRNANEFIVDVVLPL